MKADPEVTCEVGEAARGLTDQEVQAIGGQIDQAGIRERLAELRQMERAAMQSRDRFSNIFNLAAEISFIRTVERHVTRGGEIIEVISEVIQKFHPSPLVTFAEWKNGLLNNTSVLLTFYHCVLQFEPVFDICSLTLLRKVSDLLRFMLTLLCMLVLLA